MRSANAIIKTSLLLKYMVYLSNTKTPIKPIKDLDISPRADKKK